MKGFKLVKKIFTTTLIVIFLAFTITMTVLVLNHNKYGITQFGDTSLLIVKKEFSSEMYNKGSLVFVENKLIKDYKAGDMVFTYHLDGQGGASVQYGKVGQVFEDQDSLSFENGETYSKEFIMGTGTKSYSNIGTYLSIIESKWGFLFIILVPNFFLFIYQLYTLIIEIKYGKNDDEIENS